MEPDNKFHLNLIVSGRVQGVGFRFAARNIAILYGIKGSIKNLSNGDVYIEAEGNRHQLNRFIEWCYKGPSYACVENITALDGKLIGYQYFDIVG
jgi:acylphosphatase